MKKILIFLWLLLNLFSQTYAQDYFSKLYRFDSLKQKATEFNGMLVSNNHIYAIGSGVDIDSIHQNSLGFFSKFSLNGVLEKQTYYGKYPITSEFLSSNLIKISDTRFAAVGYNRDSSFSLIMFDNDGNRIFQKEYYPESKKYFFFYPHSISELPNGDFAISVPAAYIGKVNTVVVIVDASGNKKAIYEYPSSSLLRFQFPTKILKTHSGSLLVASYTFNMADISDTNYIVSTQLMEIDTSGLQLWKYSTPVNRFLYCNNVLQLPNGNYLVWGKEDFPRRGGFYKYYDSKAYIAEVDKNHTILWERNFDFGPGSQFIDVKVLKDQSILAVGEGFTIKDTTQYGILFKMTGRHDSIFTRYLLNNNLKTSLGDENSIKQLDVLDNGDIIMAGYYYDSNSYHPTYSRWGWLMRTDSLGCFINNCSVPTYDTDYEENASKIEIFPNPANEILHIIFEKDIGILKKLYVSDISGRIVKSINLQIDFHSVDIKGLPNGLYFLIFEFDTGRVTKKIVVNG